MKHFHLFIVIGVVAVLLVTVACNSTNPSSQLTYYVQPGDTLETIAQQYCTSVGKLQEVNALNGNMKIVVGTPLSIPNEARCGHPDAIPASGRQTICPHPETEPEQLHSTYLPLAQGNTWTYNKTVTGTVFAWEAYTAESTGQTQMLVGPPESVTTGKFEETYQIVGPASTPGLWEVAVPGTSARDGRYGGLLNHPDTILWGRVPSSKDVIEINEVMFWESVFQGHVEQSIVLLVEAHLADVEIMMIPPPGYVTYTTRVNPDPIQTPAGSFTCTLEVTMKVDGEPYQWRTISYFVPGVGLVKEYQLNEKNEQTYLMELTGYSLK
jgi:LysM repeat protein